MGECADTCTALVHAEYMKPSTRVLLCVFSALLVIELIKELIPPVFADTCNCNREIFTRNANSKNLSHFATLRAYISSPECNG